MSTLIFVFAFCTVAVLVYMARYSGRLHVTQTRSIDAPIDVVYAQIAEFARWQAWNPWLEHEPDAPMVLLAGGKGVGGGLSWDSPRAGSGSLTHTRLQAPTRIEQQLRFAQPFRFRGRALWQLEARDGQTVVTWSMRGRVAFSMRAFAKTVQGAIALDFRYGLDRLAKVVEVVPSSPYQISYIGPREVPAMRCACVMYRGPLSTLGSEVPKAIAQVRQQLGDAGLPSDGEALAIYVKTHVKLRTTECRVGVVLGGFDAAGPLAACEVPAHRAYVVRLTGSRSALEIAWYHAMQRLRIEHLEPDPRMAPFEHHGRDADAIGTVDLHLALKPVST